MAGTVELKQKRRGVLEGSFQKMYAYPIIFTADSADASFPQIIISGITGRLASARVVFDTNTPPDTVDIKVADSDGVDLLGGTGDGFTVTGKVTLSPPEQFVNSLIVDLADNSTNSARVKVILYVF